MRALLLALALTAPQLAQQQCSDCFGTPAFWERQEQRETRERLDRLEQRETLERFRNFDQPRGTSRGTISDCPTCVR